MTESPIAFRVSKQEKAFLTMVAKAAGISLSEFIRRAAFAAAESIQEERGTQPYEGSYDCVPQQEGGER